MWKKLFASKNTTKKRWPFDLRSGAMVEFDTLTFSMLPPDALFPKINTRQGVETRGLVDLGAATRLHRFYLNDDTWIQAKSVNGDEDHCVNDLKIFVFYDTKTPTTEAGLQALAGENSPLGLEHYMFEGKNFSRVWGDAETRAAPVAFDEKVYANSDTLLEFSTHHHAMLYERQIADSSKMEYLLVSVEESLGDLSVVFSVGLDLQSSDFNVT